MKNISSLFMGLNYDGEFMSIIFYGNNDKTKKYIHGLLSWICKYLS